MINRRFKNDEKLFIQDTVYNKMDIPVIFKLLHPKLSPEEYKKMSKEDSFLNLKI